MCDIHTHIHTHTRREKEREREADTHVHICTRGCNIRELAQDCCVFACAVNVCVCVCVCVCVTQDAKAFVGLRAQVRDRSYTGPISYFNCEALKPLR